MGEYMNYLILVNKDNGLSKLYKPSNLVKIKSKINKDIYLERKTYKEAERMLNDLNKELSNIEVITTINITRIISHIANVFILFFNLFASLNLNKYFYLLLHYNILNFYLQEFFIKFFSSNPYTARICLRNFPLCLLQFYEKNFSFSYFYFYILIWC